MNALKKDLKRNYSLYLIFLPTVIFFVIFSYGPMVGLLMAFQNYKPQLGFFRSPFVGFKHFQDFFQSYYFWRLLKNTFLISFLDLLVGFPLPIIFALLLNEVRGKFFKKSIQTISYMPYFVSMVVVCSLVNQFCSQNGAITQLWSITQNEPASLIAQPQFFRAIFVGSNVWQSLGYNSIIYIAALASVDQELYEAAVIDGANRWKQVWHVTLPGMRMIIVLMMVLSLGNVLNAGFDQIFNLYSKAVYESGDILDTFVYRLGLIDAQYGPATAVGLFKSIISTMFISVSYWLAYPFADYRIF